MKRHVWTMENFKRRHDVFNTDPAKFWQFDIEGACAEYATAVWAGCGWYANIGRLDESDLVNGWEVRQATDHNSALILTTRDKPKKDAIYVLATGVAPMFILRGWIIARDGLKLEYYSAAENGRGGYRYFVPQSQLHSMEELRDVVPKSVQQDSLPKNATPQP